MGIWHRHEELQLVEGCKNQSRLSQQEVFSKMYGILYGICLRYADDSDEAEDILQNGFIKVFKGIENYKGDGSFEGWIKRIVINTAIDNYRRKKVKPVVTDSELIERTSIKIADEVEDESIYNQVPINEVMIAIQKLSPAYRTVFNLYVMEGYNHNEIAEMLEISVGTSKSNLSKARHNLKVMLQPLIDRISHE
jgi:RNA polymerase sigma-70 factor (ECF subfamily)